MAPNFGATTLADMAAYIPVIYSKQAKAYRDINWGIWDLVNMIPGGDFSYGDELRVPKLQALGVRDRVPGTPVRFERPQSNYWKFKVNRFRESGYSEDDIVSLFTDRATRALYMRELGKAHARDMDYAVLGMRTAAVSYGSDGTNFPNRIAVSGNITLTEVLAAEKILDDRNIPVEGRLWLMPMAARTQLLAITQLTSADYGYRGIVTGRIQSLYNTPVRYLNQLKVNSATGLRNGDTDPTLYPTPGFAGSGYIPNQEEFTMYPQGLEAGKFSSMLIHVPSFMVGTVRKNPKVDMWFSNDYQEWRLAAFSIYDLKTWDSDAAVIVQHG